MLCQVIFVSDVVSNLMMFKEQQEKIGVIWNIGKFKSVLKVSDYCALITVLLQGG